jgi:hypothetical protein
VLIIVRLQSQVRKIGQSETQTFLSAI